MRTTILLLFLVLLVAPRAVALPHDDRLIVGIAFVVYGTTDWISRIAIFKPGSARRIWKF